MEDPIPDSAPSCDIDIVKLTQRIVLFTATIMLCLSTTTNIIFDRRIKTSKLMQLHLICALTWGLNALLYAISFNLTEIAYLGTNETSIIFDGIARCALMFNIYRRTMCVMVGIPDWMRRAYLFACVFVCLWATAADVAMFIGYLSSNGNFQPDVANLTYIVGVCLDLTFCVASDTLYIRALLNSQSFRSTTSFSNILLPLSNITSITLIQIISIALLFIGVDQEYGYHNLTTALRIRFFAFMVTFTETVLSRDSTPAVGTSVKKPTGSLCGSERKPSVIAARTMEDNGRVVSENNPLTRQVGIC